MSDWPGLLSHGMQRPDTAACRCEISEEVQIVMKECSLRVRWDARGYSFEEADHYIATLRTCCLLHRTALLHHLVRLLHFLI